MIPQRKKPSGVDWVQQIPYQWSVVPLTRCCSERRDKNIGNRESNVLSLSYGRIVRRDVETNYGLLPASFDTYQIVHDGNIILRLTDLQNDKRSLRVGRATERGIITSAYVCLQCGPRLDDRFAYYLLYAYDIAKVFYSYGGGVRQSMKFDDFKTVPLFVPPLPTQKAIAAFLDRKTAAIDSLIEKKERLLALLSEKRAALINQAVTKGLDPNVPMKDSGVPWIGEIPAHWEVKRIKFSVSFTTSGSRGWADYYSDKDKDPIFLQSGNLGNDLALDWRSIQRVNPPLGTEGTRTMLVVGDVLICITGAKTGNVSFATELLSTTYINQHVALLRPILQLVDGKYLAYALKSDASTHQLLASQYGGTKQGLGLEDVRDVWVAIPSLAEQRFIREFLDERLDHLVKIDKKTRQHIAHLDEYRQALITAAVTGQLDIGEDVA